MITGNIITDFSLLILFLPLVGFHHQYIFWETSAAPGGLGLHWCHFNYPYFIPVHALEYVHELGSRFFS